MSTDEKALSDEDIRTLVFARKAKSQEDSAIFPSSIGQRSHYQKLVRRGLLAFDGWGRDVDGMVERDVELYKLTAAGNEAIEARNREIRARAGIELAEVLP